MMAKKTCMSSLLLVLLLVLPAFLTAVQPAVAEGGLSGQGGGGNMRHEGRDSEVYYTVQTAISFLNIFLSLLLAGIYLETYMRMRSQFALAMVIASLVLFSYALTSNPLLHNALGFGGFGLGPFAMLPGLFSCIALAILVYLSLK